MTKTTTAAAPKPEHGTVTYRGVEIKLTQQAYLDYNSNDGDYYRASGLDAAGNIYSIVWSITNDNAQCEEEDACDWEQYTVSGPFG